MHDPTIEEMAAMHEAGHTYITYVLGHKLYTPTLNYRDGKPIHIDPLTIHRVKGDWHQRTDESILILLGGPAAVHLLDSQKWRSWGRSDYDHAMKLIDDTVCGDTDDFDPTKLYRKYFFERAQRMLCFNAVDALARELRVRRRLNIKEIVAAIESVF